MIACGCRRKILHLVECPVTVGEEFRKQWLWIIYYAVVDLPRGTIPDLSLLHVTLVALVPPRARCPPPGLCAVEGCPEASLPPHVQWREPPSSETLLEQECAGPPPCDLCLSRCLAEPTPLPKPVCQIDGCKNFSPLSQNTLTREDQNSIDFVSICIQRFMVDLLQNFRFSQMLICCSHANSI